MDADCLIKLTKAGLKEIVVTHCIVFIPEEVKREVVRYLVTSRDIYPGYIAPEGWSQFYTREGDRSYGLKEAGAHMLELHKKNPENNYFVIQEKVNHLVVANISMELPTTFSEDGFPKDWEGELVPCVNYSKLISI